MNPNLDINVGGNTVKLTRKAHRKVRTGCSICKTRKIKCDEQKPQCGRCIKAGVDCDILEAQQAHASDRLLGTSWRSFHDAPGALGMADLELMFHWDAATHATFTPNAALQHFFRRNAVTISLRCEFVALSMLSLAALHLARLSPPQRRSELVDRALRYQSRAARMAIAVLPIPEEQGNGDLVENLFIFTVFTVFHLISTSETTSELLLGRTVSEDSPDWITLFLGAGHLAIVSSSVDNRTSLINPIIQYSTDLVTLGYQLNDTTRLPLLRAKFDALNDAALPPDLRAAYAGAVKHLDCVMATLHQCPDKRDLMHAFIWLHITITDFLPVLRGPDPPQEALTIFYYYCMVLEQLPQQWWLGTWAERLSRQTYDLLDDEHRSWIVPTTYDV